MAFMAFKAIMVTVCFWKQDCSSMGFLVSGHSLKFAGSMLLESDPRLQSLQKKLEVLLQVVSQKCMHLWTP